jgi:GDPmannose 4,6-dehydratase
MNYKDYVIQDKKFMRPEELEYLKGDCHELRKTFDWSPEYTFITMINEMIDHWMEIYKNNDL